MKNIPDKWQLLSQKLKQQQRGPYIKTFRDFLTTSHLVEKYVYIMEDTSDKVNFNGTEKLIMLLILLKCDYMTPTEISKITVRPIDTINKSIDGLKKKGVIKSSQSKTDRRIRKVTLTDKGLDTFEKFLPLREYVFRQAMSCFTSDEAKIFNSFLKRLREQMVHVINSKKNKSKRTLTSNSINDPFDEFSNSNSNTNTKTNTKTQNNLKKQT